MILTIFQETQYAFDHAYYFDTQLFFLEAGWTPFLIARYVSGAKIWIELFKFDPPGWCEL